MSIRNRKLKEGNTTVIYESKIQTLFGKVYCTFAGHKKVHIKTDTIDEYYCICCWKEMK
jgi:hypothetical protein